MKFNEFPYKRPNLDVFLSSIEGYTEKIKKASSAQKQLEILKDFEKTTGSFYSMSTIAYIRNTVDTRDKFYEEEKQFYDENSPLIQEKIQLFNNELLNSKFRQELEETLGKIVFLNLELEQKAFSPEIIPLMQKENELQTEYQKLYASAKIPFMGDTLTIAKLASYKQHKDRNVRKAAYEAEGKFFDENREKFDKIYDELVKNRTEQAKKLGFKNFVELGYIRQKRNCYGPEGVASFRKQVIEDLVPLVAKIKEKQQKDIGVDSLKFYDDVFFYPDGNATPQGTPDELLAAAKTMYSEMSEETKGFIELMFDMELFDVLAKDGKAPGGYCTQMSEYHCPFIFSNFNGTSGDVDVLTHEAGHAFAAYIADKEIEYSCLRDPSMEACETHSMSMEFLTSPWHHNFFKQDTNKYEISHTQDALIFIPYGTMVDNFQEIIYSHPELTPEERNQEWLKLEKQFRPYIDFDNLPFYSRGSGWQRQLHIYLYPFYYIDYCMAQTVALQIFALFLQDNKKAWETYLNFVKMGGTKTFIELVHSVGLKAPLDEGCLKETCNIIEKWLNSKQ